MLLYPALLFLVEFGPEKLDRIQRDVKLHCIDRLHHAYKRTDTYTQERRSDSRRTCAQHTRKTDPISWHCQVHVESEQQREEGSDG